MLHVSHFTYGWINPALGLGMSFIGSLLGLLCTSRSRLFAWPRRAGWLAVAAVAIGGIGIWLAHFLMMLGFTVPGGPVRYDVTLTVLSAVAGVLVVGAGLLIVSTGTFGALRLAGGGLLTGLGIAAMHYTGMAAVHVGGTLEFHPALVIVSVLIAVAAATAALWFSVVASSGAVIGASGLIMAVAVAGMHYTGMAAVEVRGGPVGVHPAGADPSGFLTIITLFAATTVLTVLYFVFMAPDEHERSVDLGLRELLARRGARPAEPAAAPEAPGAASAADAPVQPLRQRSGSAAEADAPAEPAAEGDPRRSRVTFRHSA